MKGSTRWDGQPLRMESFSSGVLPPTDSASHPAQAWRRKKVGFYSHHLDPTLMAWLPFKTGCLKTRRTDFWTWQESGAGKERVGRMERAARKHTLPYVKQAASGNLLYHFCLCYWLLIAWFVGWNGSLLMKRWDHQKNTLQWIVI